MDNITKVVIGLSVLSGIILIVGLGKDIDRRFRRLEEIADNLKPKVQTRNVIGNPDIPETFYNTPEGSAYLTIDGKPVDEYLRSR